MEQKKHESDMTPREKRREKLEMIRSQKGIKKAEYLWTYYRSWLLVLLLAAAGIFVLVFSYQNRHTRVLLSIAVSDANPETEESAETLKTDLRNALGDGGKRETVTLDTSVRSGDNSALALKRMVVVGAGNTDLFICDETTYEEYREEGAFQSWQEALGGRYSEYADLFEDGRLDLSGSSRWQEYGLTGYQPACAGVLTGTEKQEELCRFLDFFFRR